MGVKGVGAAVASTGQHEDTSGVLNIRALDRPGNREVQSEVLNLKKEQLANFVKDGFPKEVPRSGSSEQGHGKVPSAAEQAYAKAMETYEAALAKYNADVAAHNAANSQNSAIKANNQQVEKDAAKLSAMAGAIETLSTIEWKAIEFDNAISWEEMKEIANYAPSPYKEAAKLVMSDQSIMDRWPRKPGTTYFSKTPSTLVVALEAEARAKLESKQNEVPVPPHPGSPPSPPPPPGGQAAPTPSTPPVTTQPTQSTQPTQPTQPTPSTQSSPSTGSPDAAKQTQTPDEFRAKALENSNKVPAFSSSATTGEGRMQDGLQYCQNKLEALQSDLASAAARGDQGAISLINSEIAKFQAGLSALMQMMKQQQEMQSNMSKMFNDMAASAIRNMR